MTTLVSYQSGASAPRIAEAATYGAGKFGQAATTPLLEGVAVDTFIRPGSSGPLTTGTIEAWVQSTATNLRLAFSHPGWYWFGHNASGRAMLNYGYGGVDVTITGTTATLNDGNWHHVAVVFQSGAASVYVDGTREGTSSSTPDGDTGVTDHFIVGGLWDAADFDWTGSIDDVRLSNTARYTGTTYVTPTAPLALDDSTVHLWRLDGSLIEAEVDVEPPDPDYRYRLGFEPLVWDGAGYPARHPGAASVTYIGPVNPDGYWQENDLWIPKGDEA